MSMPHTYWNTITLQIHQSVITAGILSGVAEDIMALYDTKEGRETLSVKEIMLPLSNVISVEIEAGNSATWGA